MSSRILSAAGRRSGIGPTSAAGTAGSTSSTPRSGPKPRRSITPPSRRRSPKRAPPVAPARLPVRSLAFPDGPTGTVRLATSDGLWSAGPFGVERLAETEWPESFGVERLTRLRTSKSGGAPTTVAFENRTDRPVLMRWVSDGYHEYATIPPGESWTTGTYAGHVWGAGDPDGRVLAAFAATAEAGYAVIDGRPSFPGTWETDGNDPPPPGTDGTADQSTVSISDGDVILIPADGADRRVLTDAAAETPPAGYDRIEYRGPARLSPEGRTVAAVRIAVAPPQDLVLTDPGPPGTARATEIRVPYRKPGDPLDRPAPVFFDADSGDRTDVPTDRFPNPYSLTRFRWSADGEELFFLHNPRGHRSLQLLAADRETGAVRVVIDERSDTFVDYSQKTELRWLGDGTVLWASERTGWNHLYRIDASTGEVRNAVTSGEWVVRDVVKVEGGRVWFSAGGVVPGQDPYHVHLCRADLDGSGFAVLTSDADEPGDGTHAWTFSPDGGYLLDRFSRVDLPPVTVLRVAETGAFVTELERADPSARLATGWRPPVRFAAPGRDGETMIHGLILFPPGFDAAAAAPGSLPVVEQIYAGPHGAHVPKDWGAQRSARELAALGFAVVRCDGMGTNWRSKAFHDVCWRDLADAGFPDRIAWIRAAAERFPALDPSRVGIYGGSAGGQNAMRAVLDHADFYRAAAADCGCHDNRVDKLWWNEAWLGEYGPHYWESSNALDAANLGGALLLTVGGLDRNVDPISTMQVCDALNDAGKDYELVVFPRGGHGIGESDEGRRRRAEFFVRRLAP